MYCSECGNKIKEGEKFCTNCGNEIVHIKAMNQAKQVVRDTSKFSFHNYIMPIIIAIIVLFIAGTIFAQIYLQSNPEKKLIGRWKEVDNDYYIEFFENGKIVATGGTGEYLISENRITITDVGFWGSVEKFEFKIKGDSLKLIDEDGEIEYKRVKD